MADQQPWGDAAQWYPDIVALGSATDAWQAEFDRRGAPFRVRSQNPTKPRTATVDNGERTAYLNLSPRMRRITLGLRLERTVMLSGHAPDLAVAADAAHAWLAGARPPDVAATRPFLGSVALATARERGDHREAGWLRLYENHREERVETRLQPFVALAFQEPRLRRLHPYTSVWTLRFSTTSTWPYSGSYPTVTPTTTPGRYVVKTSDGRTADETDAVDALALVLAGIPR
ncbi:hypothetical protein Q0Z83_044050 [Actinoplanes sichuanensis]|uniref:DUF6193 family natural product biosynthesis protein n=1 Tax=Actinoplanes sichuanensis TaxID=512349 RepID=A0ABW4AUW9_9ACTN|nr:DUF6193 family natural product biosynthesis protein [Actinoplanes sichuanensis]BEL06214.1 hypothetical protein Q0Z83_044050 [Actinoplanes sichuanensis]